MGPIIKLPSPAPVAVNTHAGSSSNVSGGGGSQRSRLSQHVHPRHSPARATRRVATSVGPDADEDAEGEDDVEDTGDDNGDVEDKELYCFCQKLSYGEVRDLFGVFQQPPVPRSSCAPFAVSLILISTPK